jgi:hypothetical protein
MPDFSGCENYIFIGTEGLKLPGDKHIVIVTVTLAQVASAGRPCRHTQTQPRAPTRAREKSRHALIALPHQLTPPR